MTDEQPHPRRVLDDVSTPETNSAGQQCYDNVDTSDVVLINALRRLLINQVLAELTLDEMHGAYLNTATRLTSRRRRSTGSQLAPACV